MIYLMKLNFNRGYTEDNGVIDSFIEIRGIRFINTTNYEEFTLTPSEFMKIQDLKLPEFGNYVRKIFGSVKTLEPIEIDKEFYDMCEGYKLLNELTGD